MNLSKGAAHALIALIGATMLAACGGERDAALGAGSPATTLTDAAACGAPLAITGLCSNADPSLFLKVDARASTLATKCVWRTQEVGVADDMALVFRAQDCAAEGMVPHIYAHVQGYVKYRMDGTPEDQANFMLQIIPLSAGETAEQAAMETLANAPEDQRARCATRPFSGPVVAGKTFELAPNAELKAELEANSAGDLWEACGPNGVTMDAVQFWEARNGYALFHMLGQHDPQWDPASFTFYRKGADGKWAKAG